MGFQGKKNIYLCPKCGHGFVSLDVDEGTTPFTTKCLHCGDMARSMFYRCPQEMLAGVNPAIEWYHPSDAELATMSAGVQSHVATFGLISRLATHPTDQRRG